MKNKKIVLFSIIALILVFIGFGYQYNKSESEKLTTLSKEKAMLFKRDYSFTMGPDDAKVQLVEFFDPACKTCAQFHPYIKEIMEEHKGKIQLVLRYAPFHNGSDKVVAMLEATKKQNMFMKTLEMTFGMQSYWASHGTPKLSVLWNALPRVGLDMEKLKEDMKDPEIPRIIAQDIADGKVLGASKTPSYYVNGRPLQQFGLRQLKDLINQELNK
jgi:protein-disulfide isomerase